MTGTATTLRLLTLCRLATSLFTSFGCLLMLQLRIPITREYPANRWHRAEYVLDNVTSIWTFIYV